jgi:hypothetical protein
MQGESTRVPIVGEPTIQPMNFLWLDLTRQCPLACTMCYNNSGPTGTHGDMTLDDWHRVMTDAAELGVREVQLIGGEPTSHPDWISILDHALRLDLDVEVYSNLFHVRAAWWPTLQRDGVSLATSWFSDDPDQHDRITTRKGSYDRTLANITRAVGLGIPLRVGMVAVLDGQRIDQGRQVLIDLGVPADNIGVDRERRIGRAAGGAEFDPNELCGHCGDGRAAVLPDGTVAPCIMRGGLPTGTVLEGARLAEILASPAWAAAVAQVPRAGTPGNGEGGNCPPATRSCPPNRPPCSPDKPPECRPKRN